MKIEWILCPFCGSKTRLKIRYALNKIMEKMGLLIHYGNGWGTTDAGAKFSMWHKGVLNSDSWHPELVDEIAKFLKK